MATSHTLLRGEVEGLFRFCDGNHALVLSRIEGWCRGLVGGCFVAILTTQSLEFIPKDFITLLVDLKVCTKTTSLSTKEFFHADFDVGFHHVFEHWDHRK